jgi:ethanolamine utilization protein EutQ (cupin superfamily)
LRRVRHFSLKKQKQTRVKTDFCDSFHVGTPLVYEYTYHEMKIIVDGSFDISDETGKKVHATKGDVFYFPKGSKITFETDDFGLGFFCGQRKEGGA